MELEFIPLLQRQRDLYRTPRGMERFAEYLRLVLNAERDSPTLPPLILLNPMAKDHVPALLDELLALDADGVGARAITEARASVAHVPGTYRLGFVVADDAGGGWTNRYASEFYLFAAGRDALKFGWLSAVIWSSAPASAEAVRAAALAPVYRMAYLTQHGEPRTLRQFLAQEGYVLAAAGHSLPALDPDEIEYTRAVLAPHLDATDWPTLIVCLFGDAAARSLGYPPQGLSERAGLALALDEALPPSAPARSR